MLIFQVSESDQLPQVVLWCFFVIFRATDVGVLGCIGNVRRNPTNRIYIYVSGLWFFPSQFLKLMNQTDCRKSLFGVFSRYLELSTPKRCVLGFVGNVRGNLTNLISTNVLELRLFASQFWKLVDRIDCRKSFFDILFCDISSYRCQNDVF